ncbi:MAG TPA: PA14 domain-containing protein [Chitinispirillaceae bacterium]|nr:PA14 domain-containing protein [Chitinispirillaceae bacterium]
MVRFFDKLGVSVVSLLIFIMTQTISSEAQGLLREYWSGISGTSVSNLTSNANYPNNPTSRNTITVFEGPSNTADNYGTRIRGYIVPPTTGSYTFWIASDDNSELWLSTSADPAGKTLIASVTGYTNSREWTKYSSQQSTARTLTAGQRYYIEVLHKDGTGGDNVAVGWQGPGITGDTERPIPASRLVPYESGLLREVWTGISGASVSDLTSSLNYPSTPNQSQTIYSFEGPVDNADNYGARIRGYVVPPATGNYTFWIASDDNSELWLSTSTDPAAKTLIASVTGYTGSREWTKYSTQQSTARSLTAGQKYYIEVLHKEGSGGDNVAVGWQGPGITGDTERPIPGNRLLPWTGGNPTCTLTISNDGNGTTNPAGNIDVTPGAATTISATASSGYVFRSWSVISGTANITDSLSANTSVTINSGNASVRANFTARTYTLTLSNDGNGSTTPSGSVTVVQGAATAISATPATGYTFRSWSVTSGIATFADSLSASTSVTLTSSNATIRANFIVRTYTLTMSNDGNGSTTPSGTVTVNHGAVTAISAIPSTGYVFRSWSVISGTAIFADSLSANTTVRLNYGNVTVRANFTVRTYTLTMSNDGNGTTDPSGTVTVNHGVVTEISAAPASGFYFLNWTVIGGTAMIANPASSATTVTLTSNATIRANFTQQMDTITISSDVNGTTTPSGKITIGRGVAFPISAIANTGYHFVNWTIISGSPQIANPLSATTTVTLLNGNGTIRANFAEGLQSLPNNQLISITGTLYDVNGNPVGSPEPVNLEMRVRLFAQAEEGNPLYSEDFLIQNDQSVQVNNGTFVIRLGKGATNDTLVNVITTNNNLWAEITVLEDEPDVLQPRTPLTASPYVLTRE